MSNMVQVVIDSVRVSLMSPQRVILLRQLDGEIYLPIWVGPYEAESISIALQEVEVARPLTHDLLKNVISTFGARVLRVEIIALRDNIFFGNIVTELNGEITDIDCRPSDAIAIAVRTHVPILVDTAVMDSAGILEEKSIQDESPSDENLAGIDKEHLSIFEDFLNQLEENNEDGDENPEADSDPTA